MKVTSGVAPVDYLTLAVACACEFAWSVGKRLGFGKEPMKPHNLTLTMLGAALLWVGWYGFNGGSAVAANAQAGMAILVTHTAACAAAITWSAIEWLRFGKPSMIGAVTGLIAGLATITPASGFVGPIGGLVLGVAGGAVCFYAVQLVKKSWKIDDSLDVFAVHGVGGILGTLLLAVFVSPSLGGIGSDLTMGAQLGAQVLGVGLTVIWSLVATFVLALAIKKTNGLRVREEDLSEGLDLSLHGERAHPD